MKCERSTVDEGIVVKTRKKHVGNAKVDNGADVRVIIGRER